MLFTLPGTLAVVYRKLTRTEVRSKVLSNLAIFIMLALLMPVVGVALKTEHPVATTMRIPLPLSPETARPAAHSTFGLISSKIYSLVFRPSSPSGFEAGRMPSAAESLANSIGGAAHRSESQLPSNPSPAPGTAIFDFDEDGKSDIGRWHSANTEFKVKNSTDGSYSTYTIGSSSAVPVPGDFDGDGKTDAAVFNAGSWTIKKSSNGSTQSISFGTTGDKPVAADYDGDGLTDAAVFRPSTNVWWILKSSDSGYTSTSHGASGDIPITGNWDGDAYADLAVFRPSNGNWYVQRSTAGSLQVSWGLSTDVPVGADFDGDDKTDVAVYRPSSGVWWVMKSSTGFDGTHFAHSWGNYGDQPAPADYDGDGEADLAVWRPNTGVWYIAKSSDDYEEFEYHGLGVAGDIAVPSSYLKQVGITVEGDEMALARLSPKNATGGTNLYSRNFSWGKQLVNLPGRSGLDAGFGISYNSLVWTKLDNEMYFDVDQGNVSPGFRLGFPTIEPAYYNRSTYQWNFLMVTPSGSRVEFRQTAVSNTYETADSSYSQLKIDTGQSVTDPVESLDVTVTTTDGTAMTYEWLGGAYRCSKIRDRNGNYISITHDEAGTLRTVRDTLDRVITVNYDSELYPTSITQTWRTNNGDGSGTNTTHTWASFTYADTGDDSSTPAVSTNFSGLSVVGPANSATVRLLKQISYADGSYTRFTYNGYVQVTKIENFADDDHLLSHVRTNLDSVSGAQSDCPRFAATYSKIDGFNLDQYGQPQEATLTNSLTTGTTVSDIDGSTVDASMIQVALTNHPNGNITNIYVGVSGWKEGLPIRVDDWAYGNGLELQRSAWTKWTQDDTTVTGGQPFPYILNPRVIESKVGDGSNTKKTSIEYWLNSGTTVATYGLVKNTFIYDTDLTTVLKKTYTTYNLDSAYTSRRIIGLPSSSEFYGRETSGLNLMSKITYAYDEGSFSDTDLQQNVSPVQHDNSGYGSSFVTGRGNVTSTTRWNVEYPTNSSYSVTSSVKYNTAGSPVARVSPWDGTNTRTLRIGYADNFNSTVSVSTYAYPTILTDPAGTTLGASGHTSTAKYRYDIGANVEAGSPSPAGNYYGKTTKRIYSDSTGRLEKESTFINSTEHSYVRYEYPSNGIQSKVYAPIIDADADGNLAEDEVLSETWTDGAGRVRHARTPHSFDSNGDPVTWSGTYTEYDLAGRVKKQLLPTEVNSTWSPTGDDTSIWRFEYQEYDWMGRVTRKINTDGNPSSSENDSDVFISYSTCGCAGGLVTTIRGEEVTETDWYGSNASTMGRRTQKIHEDILGRTYKTEVMKWNGTDVGTDPYLVTETTFNGRDQATTIEQTDHTDEEEPVTQITTMTYDGHGRLATRHIPQQDAEASTAYSYNPDGSILKVTDARSVQTNHVFSSRGLLTEVTYTVPEESEVPASPGVYFEYDNLGNRTEMTDGLGEVDYEYNSLSQLTAEVRDFTDDLPNAPITGSKFRLEYTYALNGQLKSLKDPYGQEIFYGFDKVGRLNAVTGSSFAGVTSYASSASYRAWGALKGVSLSNGTTASMTYDSRLRPNHYQLVKNGTETLMSKNYSYYSDDNMQRLDDLVDDKFDRITSYDVMGRPKSSKSGLVARGGTPDTEEWYDVPYVQSYLFNAFSNLTERDHKHWGPNEYNFDHTYVNNRLTTGLYNLYDADGRQTQVQEGSEILQTTYDSAGRATFFHRDLAPAGESEITRHYDGDGLEVKREKRNYVETEPDRWEWQEDSDQYFIRSTVRGGEVVTDVEAPGYKTRTYVRAAGAEIAWQNYSGTAASVVFQHWDAAGMSYMTTQASTGGPYTNWGSAGGPAELDAMGGNVGTVNGMTQVPGESCIGCGVITWEQPMYVNGQPLRFNLNGMDVPLSMLNVFFEGKEFALIQWQANLSMREIGRWYRDVDHPNPAPLPGADGIPGTQDDILRIGNTEHYLLSIQYDTSWHFSRYLGPRGAWRKHFVTVDTSNPSIKALHFKSTDEAGRFLGSVLGNGDCKKKMEELIRKFAEVTGVAPLETDLGKLFDQIKNQSKGGFTLNVRTNDLYEVMREIQNKDWENIFLPNPNKKPGVNPMGLTTRLSSPIAVRGKTYTFNNEAYVGLREVVFNPSWGRDVDYWSANNLMIYFIHELLHAAASKDMYSHDDDERLQKAVLSLGSSSVNIYIQKHCRVPRKP